MGFRNFGVWGLLFWVLGSGLRVYSLGFQSLGLVRVAEASLRLIYFHIALTREEPRADGCSISRVSGLYP